MQIVRASRLSSRCAMARHGSARERCRRGRRSSAGFGGAGLHRLRGRCDAGFASAPRRWRTGARGADAGRRLSTGQRLFDRQQRPA